MTSNELAQKFIKEGKAGQTLSAKQGDWLFSLAEREGRVSYRGQRVARGDGWTLTRVMPAAWLFEESK